jgi:hypothetical protein
MDAELTSAKKLGYIPFRLALSQEQKKTLVKVARTAIAVTLQLTINHLYGKDKLGFTGSQIAHSMRKGAGATIKLSKTQLKQMAKMGAFFRY